MYRGELDSASPAPNSGDLSQAKWKSQPILLAPTQSDSYRDSLFDFGKTYVYQVRSLVIADGNADRVRRLGSGDRHAARHFPSSGPAAVWLRLQVPGESGAVSCGSVVVHQSGNRSCRLPCLSIGKVGRARSVDHLELLVSPAYRDTELKAGGKYWYVVTAVDRAGNESTPSRPHSRI